MPKRAAEEELEFSIATAPPTAGHRRLAIGVVAAMLVAYVAVLPHGSTPLPRIDSFIPTVFAVIFVTDLITAVLLFAQFAATGSRPLRLLASGYLFSALIVVGYVLTFPGAFAPAGLLGAGPQSAAWLYLFWRAGFAASIALYAGRKSGVHRIVSAPRPAIFWSAAIVTVLVCVLVLATTGGREILPGFLLGQRQSPLARYYAGVILIASLIALLLLVRIREKSILDLWLIVASLSWLGEAIVVTFFFQERYSLTFYAIRLVGLPISKVVLVVLLWETIRLYTNVVLSNRELRHERASRLTNAAAVAASIAHEIRQPLTGIHLLAYSGQLSLERATPEVGAAKKLFTEIKDAAFRANEVFDNFLRLFRGGMRGLQAMDVNALTRDAISLLQKDLDTHGVTINTELAADLPVVQGHSGQLREVILNLIQNAIDAVTSTTDRPRVISIGTSCRAGSVSISVQDTGPGIEPENMASIFDPFVTTKSTGTGLGLAICKMIVDQHGGNLSATSGADGGARFEITLPATKTPVPQSTPAPEAR